MEHRWLRITLAVAWAVPGLYFGYLALPSLGWGVGSVACFAVVLWLLGQD